MKKEEVINYLISLRESIVFSIDNILYDDITHSLTFNELQQIDHLRNKMAQIDNFIKFLEKEGN